jgi:hypothetical protein
MNKKITSILAGVALAAGLVAAPATVAPVATASAYTPGTACVTGAMAANPRWKVVLKPYGNSYLFWDGQAAMDWLNRGRTGDLYKKLGLANAAGTCVVYWQWKYSNNGSVLA